MEQKPNFWVGYCFITAAFLGQLYCASLSFRAENRKKLFYRLPLISISLWGTFGMLFFGGLTMAILKIPEWIGTVACLLILGATAIAVVMAAEAAEIIDKEDEATRGKILFIRMLTADAKSLMDKSASSELYSTTKKVYEAARYSDPVSCDALAPLEAQITLKFNTFNQAVSENSKQAEAIAEELLILLNDRNNKCKYLK